MDKLAQGMLWLLKQPVQLFCWISGRDSWSAAFFFNTLAIVCIPFYSAWITMKESAWWGVFAFFIWNLIYSLHRWDLKRVRRDMEGRTSDTLPLSYMSLEYDRKWHWINFGLAAGLLSMAAP